HVTAEADSLAAAQGIVADYGGLVRGLARSSSELPAPDQGKLSLRLNNCLPV
ncbi:MAG: hypothetical protein QG637_76, partial [Chloroflexota bacterium]|nr:hypothetical protein [Chloroflexota bacterium]